MGKWISCKDKLPPVEYDYLGNWTSPMCLLWDKETGLNIGYYNPVGVFESMEEDGPAWVGRPAENITHWMVAPKPPREAY